MSLRPGNGSEPAGDRAPMRNRVTPWGDIVAIEQRGAWLGNRGILHRGTDVVRFHSSDLWIICRLQFKDWRLPQWKPSHFTVLFFYDEAVALAAGHRPCALCRRADYNDYRAAWVAGADERAGDDLGEAPTGLPLAKQMDRQLHHERIVRGTHRRRVHPASWPTLPPASFVAVDGQPHLVLDDSIRAWTPQGYLDPRPRPRTGVAELITPPSSVAALRGGFRPQVDPSALVQS